MPLFLAALIALASHLPGTAGTVGLGFAGLAAVALALLATVAGSLAFVAGHLPGPVLAFEDSDTLDALGRTLTYVRAGVPRLVTVRLTFLSGVLLGSAWRALRAVIALGVAYAILRGVAGAEPMERIAAVWGSFGRPPDADRLGIGSGDVVLAAVFGLAVLGVVVLWLADLWSRIACARCAAYLWLRHEIDGVSVSTLRSAPSLGDGPGSSAP